MHAEPSDDCINIDYEKLLNTTNTLDSTRLGLDDTATRQMLEAVAAHAFEAITITTAEPDKTSGPIVYVNDAFTALTGFSAEEVIGKTPGFLQGPGTEPAILDWLTQNLATGRPFHGKAVNYRRDWSEFLMEWKIFSIRNAAGDITHYIAFQREATPSSQSNEHHHPPANHSAGSIDSTQMTGENTMNTETNQIDIGISEDLRKAIADGLARLLADTYTLYLKTHGFHWNVTGPLFNTLHLMFEEQYQELSTAVDTIAERIRALGFPAPGSYAQFAEIASIQEETKILSAEQMLRQLVKDQETVVRTARSLLPLVDEAHDEPSADLVTQRMQVHEKTAWMLRSLLG